MNCRPVPTLSRINHASERDACPEKCKCTKNYPRRRFDGWAKGHEARALAFVHSPACWKELVLAGMEGIGED